MATSETLFVVVRVENETESAIIYDCLNLYHCGLVVSSVCPIITQLNRGCPYGFVLVSGNKYYFVFNITDFKPEIGVIVIALIFILLK
jgi:hypothetical protein